jgi:hypothetical protein
MMPVTFSNERRFLMRNIRSLSVPMMALCLMVSFPVLAQEDDEDEDESGGAITVETLRTRVPDTQLRAFAKLLFRDDIKAGRLSEDRAFAYYKCASERYQDTVDDETLLVALGGLATLGKHMEGGTQPGAAEKTRVAKAVEKARKVQMAAESACQKEFGISGITGKAFPSAGKSSPSF